VLEIIWLSKVYVWYTGEKVRSRIMQEIIIDNEFKFLLPVLDEKAFTDLEADILENGVRDSLVLWEGILIDGYNRFNIAQKHDLPFNTVSMEFNSRDEVVIWIIRNQIARRNLTPFQLRYFRGLHYHADRRSQGDNNPRVQDLTKPQNEVLLNTATKLAKKYNVSRSTIERDSKLADALIVLGKISPEAKLSILSGETKITRSELDAMLAGSEETVVEIAESIEKGTFAEHRAENASTSDRTLDTAFGKISDLIRRELTGLSKVYTPVEVKAALRSHIAALEEIYKQM